MNNIDIAVERPLLFLILIPALLLGIIPFLRIQKRRRASIKHLVPFILHLSLIFILSGLLAGITVTETTDERLSTKVVFVADVSDSNIHMKNQMNNLIRNVIDESDAEKDSFGLVLFANDVIKVQDSYDFDEDASDFLKYDTSDTTIKTDGTNIGVAITAANNLFPDDQKVNKKIIVLSDGLETLGDSVTVAKQLNEGIQVSGAYFNTVDPNGVNREVQLVSINTNGRVPQGGTVQVEFVIKSTKFARKAELKIEDGDIITTKYVDLQPGENVVRMEYEPQVAGVNTICASVSVDSKSDLIAGNNVLYAWYSLDDKKTILIVDGDADKDHSQFEQIKNSAVLTTLGDYTIKIVGPKDFPTNLEGLLDYDQVVLMDVNFDNLHSGAASDLRRYVEEVGRGLFVSFGDNFYEMGKGIDGETGELVYRELELESILPVDLKLEGEKETVGMVLVVDLSSSMKELMDGKSRFELVVEGVKKVLMLGATPEEKEKGEGFEDTDYIGVICFDSGAHVALEMQELGDIENREKICEDVEWELRHYYNWYYLNPDGTESDYPVTEGDGDTYTKLGYSYPSSDAKNPKGGYDKETKRAIRSYGTNYKWAIQEASDMLDDTNDKVMLHIKQVLFMSDGAPSDAGSGYVGIVERMANGGIKTSAIAAGLDLDASKQSKQKEELKKISNAGGGDFFVAETADALTNEIVEKAEEVTAQLINERNVLPMENSYNSSVLQGIHSKDGEDKFEIIGGYYTSTIKQGADLILYVDKMKPLYAEWQFGLGKVAVFMTDLGNINWTQSLFSTDNGLKLVSNMLNATMNREVDSTGLEYEATRDGNTTTVTVNTPVDLRKGESLILQAKDKNGDVVETIKFKQIAVKKYRTSVTMGRADDTYTLEVMLVDDKTSVIKDMTAFAVNGHYNKEFDVFVEGGDATLAGISSNGGGGIITDGDGFFDDIENKIQVFNHDVTTPVIIAALIIFLLDILFRNIVVKKKEKQPEMTEEERLASMRGR